MKTSTALSMVLVSVSCYAAPIRTDDAGIYAARQAQAMRAELAIRANAPPVAPPAPDVRAQALDHAHWFQVEIPKSHSPSHGMASQVIQVQT
ncbi:hypothetical protein AWB69_01523 [Caballeronia udeis]|uniref:Lipoprotein n=1 Tax=Caballeronia udeis TaxID=1232866 RepID=A0A158FRM7_9BURK|nr:hypothetical protein [Caballeronia udeis]SAL22462.1 hypothetical protein AWB69_01523 [Caballeronia udeis]